MDVADGPIPLPLADPRIQLAVLRSMAGGRSRTVPAGTALLHQGESPDGLIVVEEGALTLSASTASGRAAIAAILGPGEAATTWTGGDIGLAPDDDHHRFEIRSFVRSRVYAVPACRLRAAIRRQPDVALWIASLSGRRADQLSRALLRQLCLRLPDRVLDTLRDLAARHGNPGPGGTSIGLPITQDVLAAMVGGTRESVNRALRELERRALIGRRGRRYVVRSPSAGASS